MKLSDKQLGMDRDISRRDFLNGAAAVTALGAMGFGEGLSAEMVPYPPARTGLRGSHPGSYEVAHQLVWQGRSDWGRVEELEDQEYDLIVVGAGVSGLAAAHFYRDSHPDARILILDNHDDFGGHAKRNEFHLDGKTYLTYGGSQAFENPASYSAPSKRLLADLGIDTNRFYDYLDRQFFKRHGLAGATWFNGDIYGADQLLRFPLIDYAMFLGLADHEMTPEQAVERMPLTATAKAQLLHLYRSDGSSFSSQSEDDQWAALESTSYRDFIAKYFGINDTQVFDLFQGLTIDSTASIEHSAAASVIGYSGFPGRQATPIKRWGEENEPYIFHFPDGNATVARMLVRQMIPQVANGSTMDDVLLADFDYDKLDIDGVDVRLRLNSTVVNVQHEAAAAGNNKVAATYVRDGRAYRVRAGACIMAGYAAMVPHICSEIPAPQRAAQAKSIKSPVIYTNVLLRNWRACKKLGVGFFCSPGSYYPVAMFDFPVSMNGYHFSRNPDEPVVIHMERFPTGSDPDASVDEQRLNGRRELYASSFDTIERETRNQLAGALQGGGFDPARDIAGITVNRWGHGYARGFPEFGDPEYEQDQYPNVVGRQRFGQITFAGSDAAGYANLDNAIEEAFRAVSDLA